MSFYSSFLGKIFLSNFFQWLYWKKGFSSLSFNLSKDECIFIDNINKSEKNEKFIYSSERSDALFKFFYF